MGPFLLLSGGNTLTHKAIDIKRKSYPYICIEYILSGKGFLQVENETFSINQGDTYILPKGLHHYYGPIQDNPWVKIFIVIDGILAETLLKTYQINNVYHFPQTDIANELEMMLNLHTSHAENLNTKGAILFHQIIQKMHHCNNTQKVSPDSLAYRIKRYLDVNSENIIRLDALELEFNCNKAHIVRNFKKHYHITPYEYVLQRKIELCKYYLIETDLRIKEIAQRLCFRDEYHLSKIFKLKMGLSPKNFRNSIIKK